MPKRAQRLKESERRRDGEEFYSTLKPTVDELLASIGEFRRSLAQFLKTDIETALTFSSIALQTDNEIKKQRNRQNARRGYNTIQRLASRAKLSDDDRRFLSEKMVQLKTELERLGEVF